MQVTTSPGFGSIPEIVVPLNVPVVVVPSAFRHDAVESCQPVATVSATA